MEDHLPEVTSGDVVEALRENYGLSRSVNPSINWRSQQMAAKETCFIGDWSFMPDVHVSGPDALQFFSDISVNSFEDFQVGTAKHVINCNNDGKIIGDGLLIRVDEDKFQYQNVASWPLYMLETKDYDSTGQIHDSFIFQVQGPNAVDVMEEVTPSSIENFEFMDARSIDITGRDVLAVRMGMSGEVGFELHGPQEYGEEIYSTILDAGEEFGLREITSEVRANMIEMGIPTAGFTYLPAIYDDDMEDFRDWLADFDEGRDWLPWSTWNCNYSIDGSFNADDVSAWYRSPVELGWSKNISFDHDFIGREALEKEVKDPQRTKVTLVWDSEDVFDVDRSFYQDGSHHKYMEIPRTARRTVEADSVIKDGEEIGISTERNYSYYFREMISICSIDVEYSEPGTNVTVVWGEGENPDSPWAEPHTQKEIEATVAPSPYITDRRREKLQSSSS